MFDLLFWSLVALCLAGILFWVLAPSRMLWALYQWQKSTLYRCIVKNLDALDFKDGVVFASSVSPLQVLLLHIHTKAPITAVVDEPIALNWIKRLFWRCGINIIDPDHIAHFDGKGLLVMQAHHQSRLPEHHYPCALMYACGVNHLPQKHFIHFDRRVVHLSFEACESNLPLIQQLSKMGVGAWHEYMDHLPDMMQRWLMQSKLSKNRLCVADSTGAALSALRTMVGVFLFRGALKNLLKDQSHVALCLPTSVAGSLSLLSLWSLAKTAVQLNYTSSHEALINALEQAGIKKIITSYRFMEKLKQKGFDVAEVFKDYDLIFLEDIKRGISPLKKILTLAFTAIAPTALLKRCYLKTIDQNQIATILFSSGSEGAPKGVQLSFKNLYGNALQALSALEPRPDDTLLATLPIFHAFGLTATVLMPLIEGVPVVCHPDPRDAVAIGRLCYQYKASILCGTSTFFRLYAKSRSLKPEMLASLRMVLAGAERLQPEIRTMFEEKFQVPIYEGYGTTELAPVVSCNRPDGLYQTRHIHGTVGQLVDGCMARIIDPETMALMADKQAGMISITGVNVMVNYLNNPEKTSEVIYEHDGMRFYQTGDKGYIDAQGFLKIVDRYSRFAKIGGEMVSLGRVEAMLNEILDPDKMEILIVATSDARKGEILNLLYSGEDTTIDMKQMVTEAGIDNLSKPQNYFAVDAIPKLGSGKTDYAAAKALALSLIE